MNWIDQHLGSMAHMGDFYIPQPYTGNGGDDNKSKQNEQKKHIAGTEQIKRKPTDCNPQVRETNFDYPRLQKFFTWDQFLEYVDWRGKEYRRASQVHSQRAYDVTLTYNFDEAMDLARYGWPEGLEKIKNLEKMPYFDNPTLQQTYNIQTQYDIAGNSIDIGRHLSGDPCCMRRIHFSKQSVLPTRIQKVFIVGTFHGYINTNDVIQHGYNVYQVINAMEMANIQTEITLCFPVCQLEVYSEIYSCFYETYIKLKDSTDIISPEKLLFCVAHPAMLRRLVWSEQEKNPRSVRKFFGFESSNGYGSFLNWCPPYDITKDAIIIPSVVEKYKFYEMVDTVRMMIKQQYDAQK